MTAATVLREFGSAIRGDWSSLDGRSIRDDLDAVAAWIEMPDDYPGDDLARRILGICGAGAGHWCGTWYGYCDESCGCTYDKTGEPA